jgi:arginine exporter protein ArgO
VNPWRVGGVAVLHVLLEGEDHFRQVDDRSVQPCFGRLQPPGRQAAVAGLLAGYGIAMPVGAVATYLVALTARTSLKIGASAALGVATADGLYALIASIGGSTLTHLIEPITLPLRWASALVLIALATRSGTTAISHYRKPRTATRAGETPTGPARAYLGLLGMTMMNPTTVIYFAALVLGSRTTADPTSLEQALFVLAAFAASASWQLLLAGGGALLGRVMTGSRGRLTTAMASSTLMTALAIQLLTSAS